MSHMRLVGVTEQQHSSCNRSLHSQYCDQSSPGNDSDQSPSHIGHCASFTTCSPQLSSTSFLWSKVFAGFSGFAGVLAGFAGVCWIFWLCWGYGELWRTMEN